MSGKNKGLGRGLDALLTASRAVPAPTSESRSDNSDLTSLPIEWLQPGKYQPRKDMSPEALEELASSITAQGVIQPIVVRPVGVEQYEIIAGERRWRASQMAQLHEVPVIIKDVPDEAAVAIALIENIQREDLNAMEEAQALDRLILEFQLTQQEAAEAVGKSRSTVTNLLRLNSLENEVKTLLEHGDIEMGHARALLSLTGEIQVDAAQHVAGKGLNVRETENYVRRLNEPKKDKPIPTIDPDVEKLQTRLSEQLGAAVKISHNAKGKGKLTIDFGNLDQLDGILAHIAK
ncbi:ParB/RepB/Spo0J family partition protein [Alteromonas sp. LMIT006]|jgi:ParB family chromosome partitioning protein|uniref:ParB/RepB/Spo0J family partition protein n=1 Tax=Alteromonadaceae TaxID=72275 RepID=UPI0020CA32D4|nr:ParB/RepB/Spo0J family partition protein [Alteromonas sp. LMIT006]UTP73269.1 ParB/RepB/Spo0J family partition protein [Alteromonas sp. LMIT006]